MFRRNSKWPVPSLRRSVRPRETVSSVRLSGIQPEPLSRLGLPREKTSISSPREVVARQQPPVFLMDLRQTTPPPPHRPDSGKTTFSRRFPISLPAKLWVGSVRASILAWQKRFSHRVGPQVFRRRPAVTAWNRRFLQPPLKWDWIEIQTANSGVRELGRNSHLHLRMQGRAKF
jgi:hypothetical protein